MRDHKTAVQEFLKAEQGVKLARLQDRKADFRLRTGQLAPKCTPAELELAAQMKVCCYQNPQAHNYRI